METEPAQPALDDRKAVKDLINISFEAWKLDESELRVCNKEVDGWVSNRHTANSKTRPAKVLVQKRWDSKRHIRSFSARKPTVITKDKSVNALSTAQSSDEFCDISDGETTISRPPRVIHPFGYSSGNVCQARDLLKQFPPRKPRRDPRVFPYIAYSLVKQAAALTDQKPPTVRRNSQPPGNISTPKLAAKPPRPSMLKEASSVVSVKTVKEDQENKPAQADKTFQENVTRYMQPTTQEVISLQQKQIRRLNTSIALARFL